MYLVYAPSEQFHRNELSAIVEHYGIHNLTQRHVGTRPIIFSSHAVKESSGDLKLREARLKVIGSVPWISRINLDGESEKKINVIRHSCKIGAHQ